jgi:hypothetical protein
MSKFIHKIAMRCNEQQWKESGINDRLLSLGYDTSELKFLPNMPYVATQYKGIQSKIGSTNSPYKEERRVMDAWNPDLFYALCCQQDNDYVSVGEYFTHNKTGSIRLCTRLDDKWNVSDYGGSNDAFQKSQCHKSTFDELLSHFIEQAAKELITSIKESPPVDIEPVIVARTTMAITPPPMTQTTGPMSFKEVLNWFGQGKDVVEGSIENGEIRSKVRPIEAISKDSVLLVGNEKGTPFTSIYKNQETFLLHALSTLKSNQN